MRISLLTTLISLVLQGAWAKCFNSLETVVEALDVDYRSSVATALSQAVAQSRGLFLAVREKLKDAFSSSLSDGKASVTESSTYEQEITARYGGLINGFRVEEHGRDSSGLYRVRLLANVCLDPALVVYAQPDFLGGINEVVPGWIKTYVLPYEAFRSRDMLTEALSLGASFYASIDVQVIYRKLVLSGNPAVSAQATAIFSIFDVRSGEVLDRATFLLNSVAPDVSSVNAQIARELTPKVAGRLVPLLARESGLDKGYQTTLYISPLKRLGNRHLILQRLAKIPGILRLAEEFYDGGSSTFFAKLELAPQVDPCSIAKSLSEALEPQMRTIVAECKENRISLRVYQE